MRIIVLGSNGMLGKYVAKYLAQTHEIIEINRDEFNAECAIGDIAKVWNTFVPLFTTDAVLVNCMGVIKPQVEKYGPMTAIAVNSVFPRLLANLCDRHKVKMIHITTDCVFSGNRGNYNETCPHDALDVYGKTKSLGEPANCTVIRTSIIGEEITNKRSLVEWVKSNQGKSISGFTNHPWNGVTCLQLAKIIGQIIDTNGFWNDVRHIYSPDTVTKFQLLSIINDVYQLGITVNATEAKESVNRSMVSIFDECKNFQIPRLIDQVKEMKEFKLE